MIAVWKEATIVHYRNQQKGQHLPPSIVQIHIPFTTNRRRDPHNYCGTVLKAVIDGLVQAGAWPDDTPDYVGHREPVLYKGNTVVVETTPIQELQDNEELDVGDDPPSATHQN